MFHNFRNETRSPEDAALIKPSDAPAPKHNPLEGHDVALIIDGRRVSLSHLDIEVMTDGGYTPAAPGVSVYMESTLEAALNPDVNAHESQAWNGFKPLDVVVVKIGEMPVGGLMQIEGIEMPAQEGDEPLFRGKALTPIHDMESGKQLAVTNDTLTIPVSWARKQRPTAVTF